MMKQILFHLQHMLYLFFQAEDGIRDIGVTGVQTCALPIFTELGIDQIAAEHKEWNGKVEVFNANLHKELFDAHRFCDVAEMRRRLAAHLHWYNHARTHHALGGLLVPADRYYGRVDEVLARIEAGAGRDAADLLELRERCLELFKVVSKGGVAEVWLLGQRLLDLRGGA